MSMFASREEDQALSISKAALNRVQLWEQILGFRISLQKSIDTANNLPAFDVSELITSKDDKQTYCDAKGQLDINLKSILSTLKDSNGAAEDADDDDEEDEDEEEEDKKKRNKRKRNTDEEDEEDVDSIDSMWNNMYKGQVKAEEKWKGVLNKWHARLNFGSLQIKSKMKVFKTSLWDQVDEVVGDDTKVIEKSRMSQTSRLDRVHLDERGNDEDKFDLEVYEDRNFYSMLLKTFITSSSAQGTSFGSMRADDLEALRKYKRKKLNVDRKVSE